MEGLVAEGVDRQILVGQTPDRNPLDRPEEIQSWLATHSAAISSVVGSNFSYVILDDWDLLKLEPRLAPVFVKIDPMIGLSRRCC